MNAGTARVSIALCTCNGAAYLPQQLDSLLAQRHRPIELVACDDASDDATWSILQAYAPRFPEGAKLMRNARRLGINANFEQALRSCSGEWIAPCDQDDVWREDKLDRLLAASGSACLVYSDSEFIDAEGRPDGGRVSGRRRMLRNAEPLAFAFSNCVSGHALMARREIVERALPLPEQPCYDWWLAFVASALGRIAYVDEPLVSFRRHAGTATALGGRRGERPSPHQRDAEHLARLQAFAALPADCQPVMRELARLWARRRDHNVVPSLARFCVQHHAELTRMEVAPMSRGSFGLKFVWGLALKQRLWALRRRAGA